FTKKLYDYISGKKQDENGGTYSLPGSDSCDYITKSTGEHVPYVNFHTQQTEQLRQAAQTNAAAREQYVKWFEAGWYLTSGPTWTSQVDKASEICDENPTAIVELRVSPSGYSEVSCSQIKDK
ncbi:MAG: hypothetical protein EBU68_06755, partial [Actinobacteria bacterium]|nr:hypothetical protein [Actinomycetota bacterium]